jgi:WD40 repeat protein
VRVARVFVSHASEDRALAGEVRQWLVEAHHEVFLAQDLRDGVAVGAMWEQQLHYELKRADAVVCIVTSAYVASAWCSAEVGIARSRGGRLLPLYAERDVAHPLLEDVQHIDLTLDPVAARAALVETLRRIDEEGGSGWPDDRSPFPGLRPFEADQHRVFFGRTEETKELAELLRSPAEHAKGAALLVVGPSGCGKSSLVRAGLLPVMASEPGWWTLPPIVPGADPVAALVRELAAVARQLGLDPTAAQIRQRLDTGRLTELADELLLATPGDPRRRLLIVVDQFEEVLIQTAPAHRARFAELLRPTLDGPVKLVATLRPEFLDQLLADPDLATLPTQVYPLRPLRREALRAVIERPAQLAGIDVDDGLVDRLVDDTDGGEALPLLAFTLAQLAEGVTRRGRLSSTRYDQLGGVQGALTHQADAALADAVRASGRHREEVIGGLLRLVTADEQGRPTRWRINRDKLPDPVAAELDAFVARRLLTTDADNGTGVIGVAHEAFLSAWSPLAEAITANAPALRVRSAVEHTATEWHDKGCPRERLWGSGQLAAAVADVGARISAGTSPPGRYSPARWLPWRHRVLVTDRLDISPQARDFLHASIRRDRYLRRRVTTVLSVLLILVLAAAGIAVIQQGAAQEQQRIATARQLVAQADAIRDTDPRTALQLGIAAQRIRASDETQSSLVNTLATTRYAGTLAGHNRPVSTVAITLDGHTLATGGGDGTVILWDLSNLATPRQLGRPLAGHSALVSSVAFARDGRTLASGSYDGTVILWDLSNPAQPQSRGQPLAGHHSLVTSVAFARDGRTLATGGADGTAILWDLANPIQPQPRGQPLRGHRPIAGHRGEVTSVAFAPDGHTLATASDDGTAILWDLANPIQPRPRGQPLTGHHSLVSSVAFADGGRTLATGSHDGTVILWDFTNSAQPRQLGQPLTGHHSLVSSVAFADDGRTLTTGSADGAAILWDLTNPAQPQPRRQSPTPPRSRLVPSLEVSHDGNTQATANSDGTVSLWDRVDQDRPRRLGQPLSGHTNLTAPVVFAPDGSILATASDDGTVILWDITDRARPQRLGQPLAGPANLVISVAFAADDGRTFATGSADGTVILWDITDRARPRRLGQPLTGHTSSVNSLAFAPDGNILATGSSDGTIILWDLTRLKDLRNHAVERACSLAGRGLDSAEWARYLPGLGYRTTCPA